MSNTNDRSLNKFLAEAGVCSRRKAVQFIKNGEVTVDGNVILEPGHRVTGKEDIRHKGKKLSLQEKLYLLLNKPKDYITTLSDEKGRKTIIDLIEGVSERIYPIGRLDRNTTGLLVLTNDGDFAQKLSHPKYTIKKVYQVLLDKPLLKKDYEKIKTGFDLHDGFIKADKLNFVPNTGGKALQIELHSGRNRIVRRIFENFRNKVIHLDRVNYAGLRKRGLKSGEWRYLTPQEIKTLTAL